MSVRRPTTINRQGNAGDGGSGLSAEEYDGAGDLLDRGEALGGLLGQKDLANDLFAADAVRLRLTFNLLFDQWRPDIAWAHRIAGDAVLGSLECDHLRQPDNAMLGCDVSRLERRGNQPVRRGDIDD